MTNAFTRSGLFGQLLCDDVVADQFSAEHVCQTMLRFELAWSDALALVGAVTSAEANLARKAINRFQLDLDQMGMASERDGLPVPALVAQLRAGLTADAAAALHTGATSQDVIDTALVLIMRDVLLDFQKRGAAAVAQLDKLSGTFGANPLMGRTRMQAAKPISVGARIDTWRRPLGDLLDGLPELIAQVGVVQAGGPVGLRDIPKGKSDAVVEALAKSLDLSVSPVWHGDRRPFVDIGHWLAKATGVTGKIGQDIALMAQNERREVRLEGAGGSSAMPHKQNPVQAEILVALARVVAGHQGTLLQAMVHEQERSGAAWGIEWLTLPAMCEATGAALNAANRLLGQIVDMGSSPSG